MSKRATRVFRLGVPSTPKNKPSTKPPAKPPAKPSAKPSIKLTAALLKEPADKQPPVEQPIYARLNITQQEITDYVTNYVDRYAITGSASITTSASEPVIEQTSAARKEKKRTRNYRIHRRKGDGESSYSRPYDDEEESSSRREKLMAIKHTYHTSQLMPAFGPIWPDQSPYKCWICSRYFETRPVGIPEKLDADGLPEPYGNFCDFECARCWIRRGGEPMIDRCSTKELRHRGDLLSQVELHERGYISTSSYKPYVFQEEYGGPYTNEQFRAALKGSTLSNVPNCEVKHMPYKTFHLHVVEKRAYKK